jgi:hypothetical protein
MQPIMDQIRQKFKKFRTGVIDESQIRYLYDEEDPATVSTDLPHELRQQARFDPLKKAPMTMALGSRGGSIWQVLL